MGDLPESRVNPTRPFYNTGVDYTGYVEVKATRGRNIKTTKGYIAVFVCMVTKAVHLELVSDLTSSSFLAALKRMAARRGAPRHIYSDNGTNFVGANKSLQCEIIELKNIISPEFLSVVAEMEIKWHFNAPSWPSAGGLWEAAVKSLKFHLRRVIGEQKLTFEEYSTLLTQLEACLNSRPLCALTENPEDIDYLTPSHFLSSGPTLTIIETEKDERTRWQLVRRIYQDTWNRWKAEYLCQLTTRSKWRSPQRNLSLDDIVVIHDANLPPGKWALGRIVELHPGNDGYVRVATVKTKSGVIKRPITKLSILSGNENKPTSSKATIISDEKLEIPTSTKSSALSKSKWYHLLTLLFLCFSMLVASTEGAYNITKFRTNQSLYFDKLSNMRKVQDNWKLIVYYNMEPYWAATKLFNKYLHHLEDTCKKQHYHTQCDMILLQLRHSSGELMYYDQMLMGKQPDFGKRVRRGLINGVGNLAHSLFGILDDTFAEQYQKDIEMIQSNQQYLARLWKNQTSVIEAQYNFLQRMEGVMDKQHKLFNQHLNTMEHNINTLKAEVQNLDTATDFTLSMFIANNILMNVRNIQSTLLDTLTDIYHGKFNIHLIPPDQLKNELSIISSHLSQDLSLPIQNIHSDITGLYSLLKVKAKLTDQYLILEIKMPLLTRENYEIYKVIPIPKVVQNQTVSIVPISEYVAINIRKDTYLSMFQADLLKCLNFNSDTKLCELHRPIYQIKRDENLCLKDLTGICKTVINPCQEIWEELTTVNTYLFSCCSQCILRLMCGDHVTTEHVKESAIISMGHDCVIKGESFKIFSQNQLSNQMNFEAPITKIDIPPINNIINLTISVTTADPTLSKDYEDQKQQLREIGKQIDQLRTSDVQLDQMSSHDVHHYTLIYVLICSCGVGGVVYALRRLRRTRRGTTAPVPELPAPAPAGALTPTPAARASRIDSVQCLSGSVPQFSECQCASEQIRQLPRAHVLDKETSPSYTTIKFSDSAHF